MIIFEELARNGQGAGVDEIDVGRALEDVVGFDFAAPAEEVLADGGAPSGVGALERESLDELRRRLRGAAPGKKAFLCGNARPDAYSAETAAAAYGYDELDAGSSPEDADEEKYLADRDAWYEGFVDRALWEGMPEKAFGAELRSDPFLLRADGPDGKTALACRIVAVG